jgi:hypothetical protein
VIDDANLRPGSCGRGSQTSGVSGFKGEIGGAMRRRRPFGLLAQVVLSFVLLLIV